MKFREANLDDLATIVGMLMDNELGMKRELRVNPLPKSYITAFKIIVADINQELIVVENKNKEIIGTFQLSFIQYLTYKGGVRVQIEALRVRKDHRGSGLGSIMINWAIERSRQRGSYLIQLTADKKRKNSIHFYEKLGFKLTHEGMKLNLNN